MSVKHKVLDNSEYKICRRCKNTRDKSCRACNGTGIYSEEHYIHVVEHKGKKIAIDADQRGK